jgi:hypothetical protein
MRPKFPSVEEVRLLPCLLSQEIPAEFEDINGHVNIQHYLGLYDKAGWPFFALLGMDERYFTEGRKGIFDLEHHLFYLAEIHIGDRVSIHGRLLARTANASMVCGSSSTILKISLLTALSLLVLMLIWRAAAPAHFLMSWRGVWMP